MSKLSKVLYYAMLLVYILTAVSVARSVTNGSPAQIAINALLFVSLIWLGIMHWRRQYSGALYGCAVLMYLLVSGPGIVRLLHLLTYATPIYAADLIIYTLLLLHIAYTILRRFDYAGLWLLITGLVILLTGFIFGIVFIKDPIDYPFPDLEQAANLYFRYMEWRIWICYAGILLFVLGTSLFIRYRYSKAAVALV